MISPDQHALIGAVLLALLACALVLERTRVGKIFPGPAMMLVGGVVLTNAGVLPHQSALYAELIRLAVPVGVFLLLLRANIRQIVSETGTLLSLYLVGAVTSLIGIGAAYVLVPVPEAARIAAVQTANLVGGTVNVIAVATAVELNGTILTAMLAGGAPVMTLYLMTTGALSASPTLHRFLPERNTSTPVGSKSPADAPASSAASATLDATHLATLLAMAVGTYALSAAVLTQLGLSQYLIIVVTLIALSLANIAPRQIARLHGDRELGTLLMYLFFGCLGVDVDLANFGPAALFMALFIAVAMFVHMALLLPAAKLMKASLHETLVSSIAGIGGPTTAAAMAASFGQRSLITPGILCGLLGFATATFVAMSVYTALPR